MATTRRRFEKYLVGFGLIFSFVALMADSAYSFQAMPKPWRPVLDGSVLAATLYFFVSTIVGARRRFGELRWKVFGSAEVVLGILALAGLIAIAFSSIGQRGLLIAWARTYVAVGLTIVLVRYLGSRLSSSRNPAKEFVATFLGLIVLGSVLLWFPRARGEGAEIGVLESIFTATSATCVTGLSVLPDISRDTSRFGQTIILILMQIGGLGLMTFAAFVAMAMGRGLALREQAAIRDALNLGQSGGVGRAIASILGLTLLVEGIACLALWSIFRREPITEHEPFFSALFHAVSAYCNAGFALQPDSLEQFAPNQPAVLVIVMIEIVIGGLGFLVVFDLLRKVLSWRPRWHRRDDMSSRRPAPVRLALQTKVVLLVSGSLLLVGAVFYLIVEWNNSGTLGTMPIGHKMLSATFQSVTTRTAGFSTIDQADLTPASKLFTVMLMLIGASPGSTGGGLKTVTLFVVFALVWATFNHRFRTQTFGRALPREVTDRALVVMTGFIAVVMCATLVLVISDWQTPGELGMENPFLPLLFEVASALGTTGLSTGITPFLSPTSKVCLIVVMFVGRMGPLTLVLAMRDRRGSKADFEYPEERVMIG
ncbi:MAG: potassium transporter TrkG [Planctomycetota bacterium]